MKYIPILFLLLQSLSLFALIDDILKDKNIVWAAEFTADYYVEDLGRLNNWHNAPDLNSTWTIKLLNPDDSFVLDELPLGSKILKEAEKEDNVFKIYKDSACKIPTSVLDAAGCLVRRIDSVTHEERIGVWNCCKTYIESGDYRVKQIIFYNQKKGKFK